MTTPRRLRPSLFQPMVPILAIAVGGLALSPEGRAGGLASTQMVTQLNQGATLPNGDFVSDSAGLNTFYRYFIEVPPALGQLDVEIFDADIGDGTTGGNDDLSLGGGFNSCVTYTLFDPFGAVAAGPQTIGPAGCGGTPCAACDGAWLTFYTTSAVLGNFLDQFGTAAYNNNDGTLNWAGNWTEFGDDGSATTGNVLITGGDLQVRLAVRGVTRQANLVAAGATGATLSYDVDDIGTLEGNDCADVSVSGNGGATWTVLNTVCDDIPASSFSHDISGFIATNTQVRLRAASFLGGGGEWFEFDNVDITVTGAGATPAPGHWQLRVDSTQATDDLNLYAVRAHDGNAGAGGTELNVYAHSYLPPGVKTSGGGPGSVAFDLHPYVTSGCVFDTNDFDGDDSVGTDGGSIAFAKPAIGFTQTIPLLSGATVWSNNTISGWRTDTSNRDAYGIWNEDFTVVNPAQAGNIITHYLGNELAGDAAGTGPPPSAQPEANTHRIYFETDAGAAPTKPFLDQIVTCVSNCNPPMAGVLARFSVTVRVSNPTARPITFSNAAGNVVTINVPAGVAYGNAISVNQGTVISQPAVGASGDIVWDAGVVAAGTEARLGYQLELTPAAGRNVITGTPATNGTRSTFVDETCSGAAPACAGAQLTGATFTLGPICELAITTGLATEAVVSSFGAYDDGGDVALTWSTASESGTFAYRVERLDPDRGTFEPIHDGLLLSVQADPGGRYRLLDPTAVPGEPLTYRLVEVDLRGAEKVYGPFTVVAQGSAEEAGWTGLAEGYDAVPHRLSPRVLKAARREPSGATKRRGLPASWDARFKLFVPEPGVYELTADDLIDAFGFQRTWIDHFLSRGLLRLSHAGEEVAWHYSVNKTLLFYGAGAETPYTDEDIYWLELGNGRTMGGRAILPPAPAGGPQAFTDELRFEQQILPRTFLAFDASEDFWYWTPIVPGHPTFGTSTHTVEVPDPDTAGSTELTVHLYGLNDGDQQAEIRINGAVQGLIDWTGQGRRALTLAVDPGDLVDGTNTLEVEGLLGAAGYLVDAFDLSYPRLYRAVDDQIILRAEGHDVVTVEGFSSADIRVWEIGDPLSPRRLVGMAIEPSGGGYRVTFDPVGPTTPYLVTSRRRTPTRLRDLRSDLKIRRHHRAEYLVIAPEELLDGAERLAAHRRGQGLDAKVVELEDVFDEVSGGLPDPLAVRALLQHAAEEWAVPPRYAVLLGKGSFDPKDFLGLGGDLFPVFMSPTFEGLVSADALLGDLDGDFVPEVAVGRIPALTADELDDYIDKLIAYETADPAGWAGDVLLTADQTVPGSDFDTASDDLAMRLPGEVPRERIYLSSLGLSTARDNLFQGLRDGALLWSFVGHAGLDRLSPSGLVTLADPPLLDNGERSPLLAAFTCRLNFFAFPGFTAVGEELVLDPDGGATGVLGPSGQAFNGSSLGLARELFRQLFRGSGEADPERIGDLLLAAQRAFGDAGGDTDVLTAYTFLGDPALRLQRPPAPAPGDGEL